MKKGNIYLFDLFGSALHEQSGVRPAVLVSALSDGMVTVVPLTTNLEALRFSYTLSFVPSKKNNLKSESVALIFHLKSIDKRRAIKYLGEVDVKIGKEIDKVLKNLLLL